ncbi:MAG TPA: dienelactone hydrolase family protein [bacterium]|nr:dienelactone hydrolase family protein [bacterium]
MEPLEYRRSEVAIPAGRARLNGDLVVPNVAESIVLFAHGSGSSRFSPRNRFVAKILQEAGLATLLMDLLTAEEEAIDDRTRELRFHVGMLAERLMAATEWLGEKLSANHPLKIGYFGASTGAAAALIAAARMKEKISAVVSRGGRPDLAGALLKEVVAPTLLIVGGADEVVIELNRMAFEQMGALKDMQIIPGATHLFEEPGALEEVARLAAEWFLRYL